MLKKKITSFLFFYHQNRISFSYLTFATNDPQLLTICTYQNQSFLDGRSLRHVEVWFFEILTVPYLRMKSWGGHYFRLRNKSFIQQHKIDLLLLTKIRQQYTNYFSIFTYKKNQKYSLKIIVFLLLFFFGHFFLSFFSCSFPIKTGQNWDFLFTNHLGTIEQMKLHP